ncbi:hypothetical protein HX099_05555 [Thiopseudomonas alkaliphila]|uniref:Uncharacterized protein n=1 Tax=Thiopseudomonas alkaliphila TaxID=1697053 RepID=A0AAW7DQP3_9GAMM|nr:hypothetical protein [Thiopseudomonas alkaliphila]MDM1696129.1 hypothetical protein [Thiopseudomonas alkaliphila]
MTLLKTAIANNESNRQLLAQLQAEFEQKYGAIQTQPLIQRCINASFYNGNPVASKQKSSQA